MRDLPELLGALDQNAPRVERHLWLLELLGWIRGDCSSVDDALARLGLLLDAVRVQPDLARRLRDWWQALFAGLDMAMLLSDYGFSSRSAFVSEFAERLRHRLLPATPETLDASALFSLVFSHAFDTQWLLALNDTHLARLSGLLHAPEPAATTGLQAPDSWQETLLEAITICTSQVRATGFAPELRLRMSAEARGSAPFHALAAAADALRVAYVQALQPDSETLATRRARLEESLQQLRTQLEACRAAGASVYTHLDEHGVSVSLVFRIRQLRERILRIRALMDCLVGERAPQSTVKLVAHLVQVGQDRRSLRALVASNSSMLAAKVTERSSETGEHYITRDRSEYVDMLRKSAGGGALTAITTLLKFAVMAVGLSAFWSGFWSSIVYAASFVAIQLLHFTLATKQPAMTAPAMAAKLKEIDTVAALEGFVDEVGNLVRSQVAAVVGNVGLVFPCVLLLSAAVRMLTGAPMLDEAGARHVFEALTVFGPCLLFAAFTGVVLFASSIIAGWTENWFVFNRLDSAMRYNPVFTSRLGVQRAARWAAFLRNNISGLASNISLGLLLGLLPAFAGFFGLGLELRHVTLSSGQLAAACAALGWAVLREGTFWSCVLAIPLIGALNLGVSFYCALRLALLSHNTGRTERARIREAIWNRLRHRPLDFVWPRA